uniref:Uncharacterized protein n=1 Tax=Arundo donax TaxID=35708 RepID=A0A0A9GNE7_ARUDO
MILDINLLLICLVYINADLCCLCSIRKEGFLLITYV